MIEISLLTQLKFRRGTEMQEKIIRKHNAGGIPKRNMAWSFICNAVCLSLNVHVSNYGGNKFTPGTSCAFSLSIDFVALYTCMHFFRDVFLFSFFALVYAFVRMCFVVSHVVRFCCVIYSASDNGL